MLIVGLSGLALHQLERKEEGRLCAVIDARLVSSSIFRDSRVALHQIQYSKNVTVRIGLFSGRIVGELVGALVVKASSIACYGK
jgi:hypothetical protein